MQIRLLIATLILLLAMAGKAQIFQTNNTPYKFRGVKADSLLIAAKGCDTAYLSNPKWGTSTAGALYVDTCNNRFYFHNGVNWSQVSGGGGGVDSFYYNLRSLNDTTAVYDRGDRVDTLIVRGGIGQFVDSVTTIGDSLYYWKGGNKIFVTNIATAAAGGDTTIFEIVLDSTGQPNRRVLFSETGNKIGSDNTFLWDKVNNKLVINGTNVSIGGPTAKLVVVGRAVFGVVNTDALQVQALTEVTDTSTYKPMVVDAVGIAYKMNRWPSGSDTTGLGSLFIRNQSATQEAKAYNIRSGRLDSLYASTWAGYNSNVAANYTARSFTDKNYVDSTVTAVPTVASYGKNATRDSTILLLSNGQRFAAKDSVGGGSSAAGSTGNVQFKGSDGAFRGISGFTYDSTRAGLVIGADTVAQNAWLDFGETPTFPAVVPGKGFIVPRMVAFARPPSTAKKGMIIYQTNNSGNDLEGFYILDNTGWGRIGKSLLQKSATDNVYSDFSVNVTSPPAGSQNLLLTMNGQGNFGSAADKNIAIGSAFRQISGDQNILLGSSSGPSNLTGFYNLLAIGAGRSLTSGNFNIFAGPNAGGNATTASGCVALGNSTSGGSMNLPSATADYQINIINSIVRNGSGQYFFNTATTPSSLPTFTPSAALEVDGTNRGLLIPRLTTTQRDAISSPANGLQVYNTTTSQHNYRDGSTWQAQVGMTFGTAAPTSTPTAVGNFFLDTTNKKLYVATGTTSSADWNILN